MDDVLQVLSDVGVIETANPAQPAFSAPAAFAPTPEPEVSGRLDNTLEGLNSPEDAAPKSQPSLFRKALALALVDKLSTVTSLSDESLAFFLAEPDQAGVPAGSAYPMEVTNYQTFEKIDVMQSVDHLNYSLSGNSYFEYLAMYLRNVVKGSDSDDLSKARQALLDAKVAKDQAYNEAVKTWQSATPGSALQSTSLVDALNADPGYLTAWKTEQACEATYTKLQGKNLTDPQNNSMVNLPAELDRITNADYRAQARDQLNMPCIAVSEDYIHDPSVMAGNGIKVDPKTIYYRPFYCLPNVAGVCNNWQALNVDPSTAKKSAPIILSLLDAKDQSWSDLGHSRLDKAKKQTLTAQQEKVLKQLEISMTFTGNPGVFDVDRGDWDVPNFRSQLPKLASTAPKAFQRKICKTTRVLLAWSIEITIKLSTGTGEVGSASTNLDNVSLTFLKSGLVPDSSTPGQITFRSGATPYPILLGVLAQVV